MKLVTIEQVYQSKSTRRTPSFVFYSVGTKANLGNEISRNSFLGQSFGCVSDCK